MSASRHRARNIKLYLFIQCPFCVVEFVCLDPGLEDACSVSTQTLAHGYQDGFGFCCTYWSFVVTVIHVLYYLIEKSAASIAKAMHIYDCFVIV